MCLAAIYWARCSAIYYGCSAADAAKAGFDDQFLYDELKKPMSERTMPMSGLCEQEALKAFAVWRDCPDKVEY
jgi:tRNA(Arg) A34 adenosine deaminase TadA